MKNFNVRDFSSCLNQKIDFDCHISGIKVDSRLIEPNDMLVCLRGDRVDGHEFAQKAKDLGAICLLVDHKLDIDLPQIIVSDTLLAMSKMAVYYRNSLKARFIGITGSNGKTSSKDILHAILPNSLATFKNQNTEIGVYLNLFRMDSSHEYGILEFGLDYENDVNLMAGIVKPEAGILTSLAPAHMSNFRSIEHIADQKFMLFNHVQDLSLSFYQGDFDLFKKLSFGQKSFGFSSENDFIVSDIHLHNKGIEFKVNDVIYESNLLGEHQASNCAGVIALCTAMGISDELIRKGLMNVGLTGLRTEIKEVKNSLILLDAYKSNPSSCKYALDILEHYDYKGDKIAVLSDMVELGTESLKSHLEILDEVSKLNIKHVYTLGPEFKKAIEKSDLNKKRFTNDLDFDKYKERVSKLFEEEVMILIKGSRFYALERLLEEKEVN